jgi:two-component system cell cycle response regulator
MTGRILIVDDMATNRIVMKVKLSSACYQVMQASCGATALDMARREQPDLILLDVAMPDLSGVTVCARLKADPATADIPVILITAQADQQSKMNGLEAGADDFLTKPVDEVALLARVRSLLRARDIERELRQRGETMVDFGFAEAPGGFEHPGRIALVAPGAKGAIVWKTALDDRLGGQVSILPRESALTGLHGGGTFDVFVISADLAARNEGLRLLSDLRSRPATRHAATLVILPAGDSERAAIALDLGAGDILYDPFDPSELAVRIKTQLARKRQSDRLRASVQAGLELAVTDSLTGLHNRRYALAHLDRMLARPAACVAVMMLDLDFFKQINDEFGHPAGDKVLTMVAKRLRSRLRSIDLLARVGGEEFLVALPDADLATAMDCAERLRHAISDAPFQVGAAHPAISVTMSVGLAIGNGDESRKPDAQSMINQADAALYGAKNHGRNQVTLARTRVV